MTPALPKVELNFWKSYQKKDSSLLNKVVKKIFFIRFIFEQKYENFSPHVKAPTVQTVLYRELICYLYSTMLFSNITVICAARSFLLGYSYFSRISANNSICAHRVDHVMWTWNFAQTYLWLLPECPKNFNEKVFLSWHIQSLKTLDFRVFHNTWWFFHN